MSSKMSSKITSTHFVYNTTMMCFSNTMNIK